MVFTSADFLLFLTCVVAVFYALPQRWRGGWLLAASLVFFVFPPLSEAIQSLASGKFTAAAAAKLLAEIAPPFAFILGTSVLAMGAASFMARPGASHRWPLIIGVGGNVAVLAIFKYSGFAARALQPLLDRAGLSLHLPAANLDLPLGLSFFTFQNIGYVIDVHRGKLTVERSLWRYLLFNAFFAKLAAGPIERAPRLLPQFAEWQGLRYDNLTAGARYFLWGAFKKMVVADRLSIIVAQAYGHLGCATGLDLAIATVLYAAQIYADFSGYSDMAVGVARLFGIDLIQNFRRPYFAASLTEFWRRWHISLSTWFRDYLYIPLGGSRCSEVRQYVNLAIVFVVSGLWHGANWTFVIWGGIHAVLICAEAFAQKRRGTAAVSDAAGLGRIVRMTFIFAVVCLAWIFFRAATVGDAFTIVMRIATIYGGLKIAALELGSDLLFGLVGLALVCLVEVAQEWGSPKLVQWLAWPRALRWAAYHALFWGIVLLGVFSRHEFIYRNF